MSDGIWLRYWPYQTFLPRHPEQDEFAAVDADELLEFAEQSVALQWADRGRVPGSIDESN